MPLFGKRKPQADPVFVFAHINAKAMPIDRGERFEDPLDEALKKARLGEVTGGGCGLVSTTSNEVAFVGIDIDLTDLDRGLPLVASTLEELGAPKGSRLEFERNGAKETLPFGRLEGLAIYLNGTDLPAETYANADVNAVIDRVNELLTGKGAAIDFWEGPTETALYCYGRAADEMSAALAPCMQQEPLCQRARVVRFA
jgi:hypothetical protein